MLSIETMLIASLTDVSLIREIQTNLNLLGYPLNVDGIIGPQTVMAWEQFKRDNYQKDPAIVGDGSLRILRELAQSVRNSPRKKTNPDRGIYYEITPIRRVYLDLIAYCEGTDRRLDGNATGYNILFGHGTFSDYSRHPYRRVTAGGYTSSAAGRYQIMDFTEKFILRSLYFPENGVNFAPEFQDQRCLWLIHSKRNALQWVDGDNLSAFCNTCSYEWASIPPSRYGQPILSPSKIKEIYQQLKRIHGA